MQTQTEGRYMLGVYYDFELEAYCLKLLAKKRDGVYVKIEHLKRETGSQIDKEIEEINKFYHTNFKSIRNYANQF